MRVTKAPEERRAELMAAARQLFDEQGVDRTRVSDIVKKVGVAQGVFYYYFSSKEEMVDAVVNQVTGEIRAKVDALLADTGADFCQRTAAFIETYIQLIDQFLGDDQPSLQTLTTGSLYTRGAAAKGEAMLNQTLLQLVQQGVQQGAVTVAYPVESAQVLLLGLRQLATRQLPKRPVIYSIVEHGLGLPQNGLLQYIPKDKKRPRQ